MVHGACVHVIAFPAASATGSSGLPAAGSSVGQSRDGAAAGWSGGAPLAAHPQRSSRAGAPPPLARVTFTSGRVTPDQPTTD